MSFLDPRRDLARWIGLVSAVAHEGALRHRRRRVSKLIVAWAMPALAVAATMTLVIWTSRGPNDLVARRSRHTGVDAAQVLVANDPVKP